MPTSTSTLTITDADHVRLREMIQSLRTVGNPYRGYLRELQCEIERARIVPAIEVEDDIITMNSHLRVRDCDNGVAEGLTLVFHGDAELFSGRLSVLSPLGTRLVGQRVGDEIDWEVAAGNRRVKVDRILYQPEAAGHFHL